MISTKRQLWIDLARVIGAFSVVALHLSGVIVVTFKDVGHPTWWYANIIDSASRWAVPVFIMISGALLLDPDKQYSPSLFLRKRFKKVGIPLLAWSAIFFWWGSFFYKIPVSPQIVLDKMLSGMPYFHLYFLFVMIGLYIITPVLNVYIKHAPKQNILYFLIITFFFSFLLIFFSHWLPIAAANMNGLTMFILYINYYVAGHYLRNVKVSGTKACLLTVLFFALVVFTSIATYFSVKCFAPAPQWQYFYEYFSPNVIVMSLIIFILFNSIEDFFVKLPLVSKIVYWLAPNTLGIYLIHPIVDNVLESGKLGYSINLFAPNIWIGLPTTIFLTFTIAAVITAFGRKVPIIKEIFG